MTTDLKTNIQNFLDLYKDATLYADQNDDIMNIDDYNYYLSTAIDLLEKTIGEK